MALSRWRNLIFLTTAILFFGSGYNFLGAFILIFISSLNFFELQRKAYWRSKYSLFNEMKTVKVEKDSMLEIDLVLCRGNVYQLFSQDVDRILDSWKS